MPRYHFNVADLDRSFGGGAEQELPDLAAAREEAVHIARTLCKNYPQLYSRDWSLWYILVTDEENQPLLFVPFSGVWLESGYAASNRNSVH